MTVGSCMSLPHSLPVSTPNLESIGVTFDNNRQRSVSAQGYHLRQAEEASLESPSSYGRRGEHISGSKDTALLPLDESLARTEGPSSSHYNPSVNGLPSSQRATNMANTQMPTSFSSNLSHEKAKLHIKTRGMSDKRLKQLKQGFLLSQDNQTFVNQMINSIIKDALIICSRREDYVTQGIISKGSKRGRVRDKEQDRKREEGQSRSRSRSEFRGRRTPSLYAIADRFGPSSSKKVKSQITYVSLHDLPNASNYSYRDDTRSDSLEELIESKVKQLDQRQRLLTKSMDFFPDDSQSPLKSEKGRDRLCTSAEMGLDFDSEYDSMEFLSTHSNSRVRVDFEESGLLSHSFTDEIIAKNLKHHMPDDLDVESFTISVLPSSITSMSIISDKPSLRDLNSDSLPIFVTSIYLRETSLL